MRKHYNSKSLEDLLFEAEKKGIRKQVIDLAYELNREHNVDFFDSFFDAYLIVKTQNICNNGENTGNKYTHSK